MKLRIVNVVAGIRTHEQIDIHTVVQYLPHSQYEPETFPGVVYRRRDPESTMIFFASGRMVTVGTSSLREAMLSIRRTLQEISDIQGNLTFDRFEIINIVATGNVGKRIDLDSFRRRTKFSGVYEPEHFPGLVVRMGKQVALLFQSGKIVCPGSTTIKRASRTLAELKEEIDRISKFA